MTVATTSIENYHDHKSSGRLGKQSRAIVEFMAVNTDRDWSRAELAEQLGLRLSSVCGRINELIHSRHVEPQPNRRCQVTAKTVSPVRLRGLF